MATKPPPPPRKSQKEDPPAMTETKANLEKPEPSELANLNFKVPSEFKRDFKIAAATFGKSQVELLQEMFRFWSEHHG